MGIVVLGAVFVDIKGYPLSAYIPGGRNAGRVDQVHGGVSRNIAEDIANVELRPTFVSLVDNTGIGTETDKLNLITYFYDTCLNTTGSHSTTTGDREHVLNRHQERFVDSTRRKLNPVVNSIHELHYLVFPLRHTVQCTESRATDDRSCM